jgi:hypothetical protein
MKEESCKKITYIYALYEDDNIKYIGKSDNPKYRLSQHIYECKKKIGLKHDWVRYMIESNKEIKLKILEVVPHDKWEQKEKSWISKYKDVLTNTAKGGFGGKMSKFTISYLECKNWVKDNLKNIDCINKWNKSKENLPDFIPLSPDAHFKGKGWVSWGDFLGSGRVQSKLLYKYIDYKSAKKSIHHFNCISQSEWKKITNDGNIEYDNYTNYKGDYYLSINKPNNWSSHIHLIIIDDVLKNQDSTSENTCYDLCYIAKKYDLHSELHIIDQNKSPKTIAEDMFLELFFFKQADD